MNAKLNAPSSAAQAARHARARASVRRQPGVLRPLALALASVSLLTPLWPGQARAQTLPAGMTAVQGTASVAQSGAQMTVTNSAQAILNWQSFSIGAGAAVHFNQPHASSQVLNRVLGNDPSAIFGRLSSNGQVWLLNPHGVLFGATARVDVAGLVASNLNLADHDWMSRRAVLQPFASAAPGQAVAATVTNQGELRSASGGRIVLVGSGAVRNEGLIEAPGGQVVLAAGGSVDLADTAMPYIALRVQAPSGEALNLGRIEAGRIDLQAALVNQQGLVRATSLTAGQGGRVELRASDTLNLAAGSRTLVTGAVTGTGGTGGTLVADAGRAGTLWVNGEVRADAAAEAPTGTGGRVELLGKHIGLLDGARVSASGSAGGGQVFVGGGLQGQDASLPNAQAVYIAPGAHIATDATGAGDGGRTIVWSNQATRAYGKFSARGGAQGGDGGFIETSGGWIDARPASIDATAPRGQPGEWLIDPNDLYIFDGSGSDFGITGNPDFSTTADFASISVDTIRIALEAGNNVSLTTSPLGGTQPGDIFMNFVSLDVELSQAVTLTFNAQRNIEMSSASISSAGGAEPLSVVFNPALGGNGGVIQLSNSTIDVPGGSVSLSGAVAYDARPVAVRVSNSSVLARGGSIAISGAAAEVVPIEASLVAGVAIDAQSLVQARDINVTGFVFDDGDIQRAGVFVRGSTLSATGSLTVQGTATATLAFPDLGVYNGIDAVYLEAATLEAVPDVGDPPGSLQIAGVLTDGVGQGQGEDSYTIRDAVFADGGSLVTTGGSTLQITGSATGEYSRSLGLFLDQLSAGAGGAIDIFATSSVELTALVSLPSAADVSVSGGQSLSFIATGSSGGSPSNLLLEAGDSLLVAGTLSLTGNAPVQMLADAVSIGDAPNQTALVLSTGGRIDVDSVQTTISPGSVLTSTAGAEAIVVIAQGPGGAFDNQADSGALQTPSGLWLVYADDPTDSLNFNDGGLLANFVQYNAPPGTPAQGIGNGLLFDLAPVLQLVSGQFSKVYDGGTDISTPSDLSVSGLVSGDQLSNQFNLFDPNAGTGKPLQLSAPAQDSFQRPVYGYQLDSSFVADVTPATLTLSGVLVASRPYDGSTAASVSGGSLAGLVSGEDLQFSLGLANFADANAGPGKTVTGSAGLVDGSLGLASNYSLSGGGFSTTGTISLRQLTVAGVLAQNKVYDGSTAASVSGGTLSGLVTGEDLQLLVGTGSFANADAGSGKTVSGSAGINDGNTGLASNYTLTAPSYSAVADITQRLLTVLGVVASDKVYDGGTATSVSGGVLSGLVSGQSLVLSLGTASFADANAGTEKTVTGSATLADGSNGLASNYSLTQGGFVATADITPRVVTLRNVTVDSKVYDGDTVATVSGGTVNGLVPGEELQFIAGAANFDDANAGTDKTVTGSATLADGSSGLASNYSLADGAFTSTADITPKAISLTGVLAASRPYDGSTLAAVSGGSLLGLVSGEDLLFNLGTASFDDANAGPGKTVTGSASLVNGSNGLASNYSLSAPSFTAVADITRRLLTVLGVLASDKVYDGNTTASVSGGVLSGLVSGQSLVLNLGTASFADANAGTDKTVTGSATLATGSNGLASNGLASNYSLAGGAFTSTADITPKAINLTGVLAASRPYNGSTLAAVSGGSLLGLVSGEDLLFNLGTASFDDANAGPGKTVTGSASLVNGSNSLASNYSLSDGGFSTTGTISLRQLSVAGVLAQNKVYDGNIAASVSGGTLSGLVTGEDLRLLLDMGSFANANAGTGKTVNGSAGINDGNNGLASNYTLAAPSYSALADITARPLTVAGVVASDKVYDGSTAASASGGVLSGLISGQSLVLNLGTASFADANAGTDKTVTGSASLVNGSNGLASNYTLTAPSFSAVADITQRLLSVLGVLASDKVYDGNTTGSVSGGVLSGLVSGQSLVLNLGTASFSDANAGTDKTVTGSTALADGSNGLASNYRLSADGYVVTADITRRAVTLSGVTAASKVYDGNTAASVAGGVLTGLLPGQDLQLTLSAGSFNTAAVGADKPVTGTVALANGNTGLASNYLLSAGSYSGAASITPALLSFLADPVQSAVGLPLPPLTGSVTGFIAGETLASATTGSLLFTTLATPVSPPGNYPVFGSGLLAGNYVFAQAPQNATALQQLPGNVQQPEIPTDTEQQFAAIQPTLFPPVLVTTATTGRVLDAVQAVNMQPGAPGAVPGQPSFRSVRLASMSQSELASMLAARDLFKKELFAEALDRLAQDPTLADAPPCTSLQQAAAGTCLMSAPVRELARAQQQQMALASPPAAAAPTVPTVPTVPTPTPAAVPVPPATPAPVPSPAPLSVTPPPATAAVPALPPAAAPVLAETSSASTLQGILDPVMPQTQRRVRLAAVPEIQRKVAVLIGNDRYTDARIPTLDNAANDARAVGATLQDTLGYETLVLENATRAEILRTLNRLALQLEPQDSLIIYYAGHGEVVEATGQGYWQPVDAVATNPETWISNNDIGRLLAQFAPNQVALVSDSCFSGSLLGDERIRGISINSNPQELLQRRAAVVMTSGGNEPVFDAGRNGHSPFAWNLMRTIEQVPNWRPGSDVFERVRFNVARELPQRPQYGASLVGGHVAGADYLFEQRQLESNN